ncbi:hypothetical protein CYMTET_26479 [Cymbomonas tetramitiformis]|uniref:U1 small nuclear ribonucleoprotein 70 kDa n=1 Tax=Cymbomonas tetramitiformis TaxID=36881 RepID=A0AAE0FT75_9CHLO|nr:hypothetical protein CYMTET_26479 [Cymbomonas tetramitiformis]
MQPGTFKPLGGGPPGPPPGGLKPLGGGALKPLGGGGGGGGDGDDGGGLAGLASLKSLGTQHMTGLTPSLLKLFAARDPAPFVPPPTKKKLPSYSGIGQYVSEFANPGDPEHSPPVTRAETKEEKKTRIAMILQENGEEAVKKGLEEWDPTKNEAATGDAYKTLFVARINYDTSESKLKREFEEFGPVKRINLVHDKNSGKPRGYAFIEYSSSREMKNAYKMGDGRKIDGRRVLVDVERGRTVPNWRPRRLGGGLGTTRVNTKAVVPPPPPMETTQAPPPPPESRPLESRDRDERVDDRGDRGRDDRDRRGRDDRDRGRDDRDRGRDDRGDRDKERDRGDRGDRDRDRGDRDRDRGDRDRDRGDRDRDRSDRGDRDRDRDRDRSDRKERKRDREDKDRDRDRDRGDRSDRKRSRRDEERDHDKSREDGEYPSERSSDRRKSKDEREHGELDEQPMEA